jgi:hypothetical protein
MLFAIIKEILYKYNEIVSYGTVNLYVITVLFLVNSLSYGFVKQCECENSLELASARFNEH